jgi:tetratricopeptide (TPR) repeat protein
MIKTKGGLMTFNNFLSTSKDRKVSLGFALKTLSSPDVVGILFVMTIDPTQSTAPFASITDIGYYREKEDEVLFSMQSVFRIRDIKSMSENKRIYQVDLTLTSDNDKDLRLLTERIREEIPGSGWYRLGVLLHKMGHFDKAEEVYQVLLERTTDETEKAPLYGQLASIKDDQGEYPEAIKLYEKTLEIQQQSLPPNHPNLGISYNNIGEVYDNMGDYSKALSNYQKALEIQRQSLPPNHPDLSASYNNIGGVYDSMGDYSKALSNHRKALEIQQQSLPPNHPSLGATYNNIGGVYDNMGDYSKALSYYQKDLEISEKTLPPNHPDLGASYNNIGVVYDNMGNYSEALLFYERAAKIGQSSLPANHPDLQQWRKNLDNVKKKL